MADTAHSTTSIVGGHAAADGTNAGFMTSANFTKLGLYPAVSGLTTGQCIRATGAATMAFGALDLANANAVTGVLPAANRAAPTAAETVTALASAASGIAVNSQKITSMAAATTSGDAFRYDEAIAGAHTFYGWGDAAISGANADRFYNWGTSGSTTSATENISQFAAPFACTVTAIGHWQNAGTVTNTVTDTMRIAGVDTAVTVVVGTGQTVVVATGFSVAVALSDIITIKNRENGTETGVTLKPRVWLRYKTSAAA